MRRYLSLGASILACLTLSSSLLAQAGPSASPGAAPASPSPAPAPANPGESGATPGQGSVVSTGNGGTVVIQAVPSGGTTYSPGPDPNAGLPSSSQPRMGNDRDGFDLAPKAGGGSGVVYGGKGAAGVMSPQRALQVPPIHVVRKGDTLWDLCDSYYQNPWGWPKVWSYNPQVVNPHWIYPGDQIRLRDPNDKSAQSAFGSKSLGGNGSPGALRRGGDSPAVPPHTVFLRDQGFLGDPKRDVWGELVGAVEDQMLLSDGNHVYLKMRPGVELKPGQQLTIFAPARKTDHVPGSRKPPGEIVSVKGTVKIDQFNPNTRVARGELIETLDAVERGAKIGPVGRRFDVVPPKPAAKSVQARVLSSIYPLEVLGQHQVTFLDRGSEDGLEAGTRMFVLRQGDSWRSSLKIASGMLQDRVKIESSKNVDVERTPSRGDDKEYPSEVVAELRVLRTEKYSSIALVLESNREIEPGDVALSLVGK